jgi:hypothetical protein
VQNCSNTVLPPLLTRSPIADLLSTDQATVRKVLNSEGAETFDAESRAPHLKSYGLTFHLLLRGEGE